MVLETSVRTLLRRDTRLDYEMNATPGKFKISKSPKGAKSSMPNMEIK
jgi:hypothetical protein